MQFRFGRCRIDSDSRQVVSDGHERHLSPKAFELLLLLLRHRPRVLNKREIVDALWPDTFVADVNLSVLIAELRKALGDPARTPALVRTHHRVGYQFIAAVTESASPTPAARRTPAFVLHLAGKKISLVQGPTTVGRDDGCDVVVNDASVSRRHAEFLVEGLVVTVEDLDSKNGTRVNGARIITRTRVQPGDEVSCGSIKMTLVARGVTDASTLSLLGD